MRTARVKGRGWRSRWGLVVGVSAVLLLFNTMLALVKHPVDSKPSGDAVYYYATSVDPTTKPSSPYIFRRLSPRIVRAIDQSTGWGTTFSWGVLSVVAQTAAQAVLFFVLLDVVGVSVFTALIGLVFAFTTHWYTAYHYQNLWLVDPLHNLFSVLALKYLLQRRYVGFVVTVVVSITNKDGLILLLPLLLMDDLFAFDRTKVKRLVLKVVAVVGVLLIYALYKRWILSRFGLTEVPNPFVGYTSNVLDNLKNSDWSHKSLYGDFYWVFMFLWVFVFYGWYLWIVRYRRLNRVIIIGAYWLLAAIFTCFFVTDFVRMFSWMAPIIIVTTALVLDEIGEARQGAVVVAAMAYTALMWDWVHDWDYQALLNLLVLGYLLPHLTEPMRSRPVLELSS